MIAGYHRETVFGRMGIASAMVLALTTFGFGGQPRSKPAPTHRNVAYGPHERNVIDVWLAFHDEMADPDSPDPIERESTRLACVATNGGQTTMDFDWWQEHVPGYETPHRDPFESFDVKTKAELHEQVAEVSALSLISADDPPIHMGYGMAPDAPVPTDPQRARGWKVHHVIFGLKLKEKMDALGIEADLRYPGASSTYRSAAHFFKVKFGKE
ncbi:MAG: hypothetical protein ABIP48_02700 [Planctomycetota bacterium]